ncbi:Kinase superfamily protein [Quillaja saponaria]|uniref:Kinase superfamily protein n=1 Tax=Quillaja saponaria TaxID=32244 RepID=A0AAD7M4X6_QUISA|nr:Kinase superfamily protein [Quillaja saponaria]KAJ7970056.1 Kinase superfamily protein [Quillaja saponaria]
MGEKGDTTKKQPQQQGKQPQPQHPQQQPPQLISSSPKDESTETRTVIHHQQSQALVVSGASPFISTPLYVPSGATDSSSPFEHQFETVNPKRTRYGTTGQWKLLPSPSSQQKQTQMPILSTESSPSPTTQATNPQVPPPHITAAATAAASSSDTASSPTHSHIPSLSAASGQETNKPEREQIQQQFRKGKYVSPVWKPNEMLWLARAWRIQYQGGSDGSGSSSRIEQAESGGQSRGKTRADKDREVAEFLQRHGINRDAKTAGTKWDNMLGEFRKVYEWERGGEREQVGKSYFRLSPYERKLHRLPASFDEEVFEELSQFMGSKMRISQGRSGSSILVGYDSRTCTAPAGTRALPPPPPLKEDELPLSARIKQLAMASGGEAFFHSPRGTLLGLDSSLDIPGSSSSSSFKDLRRIGKIRMTWEESVSLWAEEGELHRGRVRLQGSSFLIADELTFFDDSMVPCTMEAFEEGSLKGFSVDRFFSGQQVKVFGRRKSSSASAASSGFTERFQLPSTEPPIRSIPPCEFQDPTEYYVSCFRVSPPTLPNLFELSWHLQDPPPEDMRFPLRRDVYRDLPHGKEFFFSTSTDVLDCRAIMYDIVSPIIRTSPSLTGANATSRESFIGIWDDCINRVVSRFCSLEMIVIRKPTSQSVEMLQDQWPNVTGFVRNLCLWRGEETDHLREGQLEPSSSIVEKLLWTYIDLPYILGYYAVGYLVTFCALSRSQDRIIRTDLYSLDLSSPTERLKALVPCYRIGGLLPLLAERCVNNITPSSNYKLFTYSDFERLDLGNGSVIEMTPNTCTRFFSSRRKWAAVKEIYDFLDRRIPHAEFIFIPLEKDLGLVFKPRGCQIKPINCDQLVEALKYVTKALVALHDLSFMHRDLSWDKVMKGCDRENEWFVCGFDEAVGAPQLYPHMQAVVEMARNNHAPEMGRGLHGVKVDVWGVGYLIKTCGLAGMPKMLRELQNRCLDQNPEQRPTAADCYHHLLQLQTSMSAAAGGVLM